jgi:hypothetical protein
MADANKIIGIPLSNVGKIMSKDIGSLSKFLGLGLVSYYTGIDKWDDGTYRYIGGSQSYSATQSFGWTRVGMVGTSQYDQFWTRFVNVQVPKDAIIISAFVRYNFNYATGTTNMRLRAVASDDAPRIGSLVDWQATSWTAANVLWNLDIVGLSIGDDVDTPDISSVVQEVVNREGWVAGNAMGIFCGLQTYNLGKYVRFHAYDQTTYAWPELHIEYS